MTTEAVQLCLAHQTFSYVEDDCPMDESPHEYAYATLERPARDRSCPYCGGPNDHGRDCLPASQGGTQPG